MIRPGSLLDARRALDAGELTAVDLLEARVAEMARHEPVVQAMVTETIALAREQAAKADARLAAGERTPVLGIPVVLKDLIDVAGVPTTAGSTVLAGNVPKSSSAVWQRLEVAGAVLLGKANTHEFAYGGTTAPTRNPADPSRIVGGSSGGPAAALAAGYALGAIGTDTAGSIRIPANLCGVAGLKPTRGLVPTDGVVPLSGTLDVVGPMARSAGDLAPLLQVITGLVEEPAPSRPRAVGVLRSTGPLEPSVAGALEAAAAGLARLGARVVDMAVAGFAESVLDNFTIIGYEATAIHEQWADRRTSYTPYVRERLEQAAWVTRDDFERCRAASHDLAAEVDRLLSEVDLLLVPGVPFPASPAYDDRVLIAGEWEDRDTALCRNTAFANLTGHPVLALPAGTDGRLPVGVQLVGRRGTDLALIGVGARLEPLLPPGLPPHLRS